MKILVIDDLQSNLDAAVEQLGEEHELTLCDNFLFAEKLLNQSKEISSESKPYAGHDYCPGPPDFDMILTDLFMPPTIVGNSTEYREEYYGKEQPYGLIFMLVALRRGVKYLGLQTTASHHTSPIAWAADLIEPGSTGEPDYEMRNFYIIGNTKVSVSVARKTGMVKDWKNLFEQLINDDEISK